MKILFATMSFSLAWNSNETIHSNEKLFPKQLLLDVDFVPRSEGNEYSV